MNDYDEFSDKKEFEDEYPSAVPFLTTGEVWIFYFFNDVIVQLVKAGTSRCFVYLIRSDAELIELIKTNRSNRWRFLI